MAEDQESRTEPATGKRREEARAHGRVARSQDLNVALLLAALFAGLWIWGEWSLGRVAALTRRLLGQVADFEFDLGAILAFGAATIGDILAVAGPIIALVFAAALLANLFQVGFHLTPGVLQPDLGKLSPLRGLQRIFSLRGATRISMALVKVLILGWVLCWTLWQELSGGGRDGFMQLLAGSSDQTLALGLRLVLLLGMRGVIALLILAILDFAYQRWQFERDLRMTKQEVKEELLAMEGDPKIKARRRRIQRDIALQSMMREVPKADVVIANPTHFAVAVRYERTSMAAPKCLAKGQDLVAQRIREIAVRHRVPVVLRPQLARALYATVEVGEEIPHELYKAVAEVLAYVYRLAGKSPSRAEPAPV